ncbi:FkbM family methyltransferase [Aerosakkonema sp. BLCC-F2]
MPINHHLFFIMKQIWNVIFSHILRLIVKLVFVFTGKGGGKFANLLAKGKTYTVKNYAGKYKFNVDTTYPIEASVWLGGVYDVVTTKFFRKVIRENDVFLDIGANCGVLTLVAASLITTGKIYAFEPSEHIRYRLQANIKLNPHLKDLVKVVPLGVGAAKGQLFYHEDQEFRGNGALQPISGILVDVVSLDEWVLLEPIEKIDVIKIDVEGMEYDVLLGAKAVIEKYHPLIYFETLPIFFKYTSHNIRTIYEFLANLGYRILSPTEPHSEISFDGPYPANSVAIHPQHADRLKRQ